MVKEELRQILEEVKEKYKRIEEMIEEDFETFKEDIADNIKYSIEDLTKILESIECKEEAPQIPEKNLTEAFLQEINKDLIDINFLVDDKESKNY